LRIPRQEVLQSLNDVGHEHAYGREAEHREGVFAPVHLLVGLNAGKLVDEPLDGTEHRIEPGAFSFENPGKVKAYRPHRSKQNQAEDGKLQPAIGGHVRTSPDRAG
jgi:hypothetical protein